MRVSPPHPRNQAAPRCLILPDPERAARPARSATASPGGAVAAYDGPEDLLGRFEGSPFSGGAPSFPHTAQHLLKVGEVHGLDEVAVAPGLARPLPVVLLTPAGQRDDPDRFPPVLIADAARRVQPVQPRYADVHQDDLGAELLGLRQRLDPVVGGSHVVAGEA